MATMVFLLFTFYQLIFRIQADWSSYCVTFDDTVKQTDDQYVIRCIDTRGTNEDDAFRDPVLIQAGFSSHTIKQFVGGWFHEAKNMPQIPYSRGVEEVYYVFPFLDGKTDIRTQDALYMAKLVFDQTLDVSKGSAEIQVEGIYKTKEPQDNLDKTIAGSAYTFEDGGLHWQALSPQERKQFIQDLAKFGTRYGITQDLKWKLKQLKDRIGLKKYKESLDVLLKHQQNAAPWITKKNGMEYVYHPMYARGIIRWRLSRIQPDSKNSKNSFIYALPPSWQTEMQAQEPLVYTFTFNVKKVYTFTLRILIVRRDSIVFEIYEDKRKVDEVLIYWEGQFGSECTRHTVNNLYNQAKYPSCKEFNQALAQLEVTAKFKQTFGQLGASIKQHSPRIRTETHSWPWVAELLHEGFGVLWMKSKWVDNVLARLKVHKQSKVYEQQKQKILQGIKHWFQTVIQEEKVYGIIDLSGSHMFYLRELKSKGKFFNYWLDVNSAMYTGPNFLDVTKIDPLGTTKELLVILNKGAKLDTINIGPIKDVPGQYWENMRRKNNWGTSEHNTEQSTNQHNSKAHMALDDNLDMFGYNENYNYMVENQEINLNPQTYAKVIEMLMAVDIVLFILLICIAFCMALCIRMVFGILSWKIEEKQTNEANQPSNV